MSYNRTMLPIPVPLNFRIIAHRGASAYAPENTLAAFQLAARMGIGEIELDTQLTPDGQVVICHDLTLERYGHGSRVVESLPTAELLALDMGSWFSPFLFGGERLLTLDQLFQHFRDQFAYHVEIKGHAPGLVAAVAGLIARHDLADRCVITSFHYAALVEMQQIAPHLRRGWLVGPVDDAICTQAKALDLFQLCPQAEFLTPEAVTRARQIASEVRAWGVNGSSSQVIRLIEQILASGCDGMTINWPDWVVHSAECGIRSAEC